MSTTIDSLDIQISTSAGQASRQIHDLAIALGRLKENGKITASTNGLKKLAGALDTLNPALNAMNSAKLQQLRGALSGLANIQKLSGLNSAVNTLKKIPDVVAGLSTAKLDEFEQKMERLSIAIGPLAAKIDRMGAGFAKLPKYVGKSVTVTNRLAKETQKAADATEKHSTALNNQSLNIMSAVQNFETMINVVRMVGDAISKTLEQAMEWDGIQYRFGRAFGEDAEEVYAYAQKINDVLGINIQQFMQYSSLYGSLLSGFGMAQEKVTTISVGLTELSYDIWAAYNDRFKTLEDASEAIRSAITGEIEPIRNAGIALTEASLQEYLDNVGMAHISIEKLSEAQKAEIRYAAMMNAAMNQGIVGTYAKEMQTAEGAVRNLSQAWKGLVQAFGSLFIPLLQVAIPYVTAFVKLLRDAVAAVADFLGITFFEIDWGNSGLQDAVTGSGDIESGLNGAAEAAKKIRDYTMGFDELNVIQPSDNSSGGAGGSGSDSGWTGLDLETLWDNSVFANASKQVDELKKKIKDWFKEWGTQIAIVGAALAGLSVATLLGNLGEALGLGDKFLGVIREIKKMAAVAIILTIQYSLMSEYLENFIETGEWENYVWTAIVGALGAFGSYLAWGKKGLVLSLTVTAITSLKATFEDGSVDSAEEVVTGLTGIASVATILAIAWPFLSKVLLGIIEYFKAAMLMAPEVGWIAAFFPKLASGIASIQGTISSAATAVGSVLAEISAPAWIAIAAVIVAVISLIVFLVKNWKKLGEVVKNFFDNNIAPKLEKIKESWEQMKKAINKSLPPKVIQWFKDAVQWLGKLGKTVLGSVGPALEWLGGIVFALISGPIAALISALVQFAQGWVEVFSGVVQIVSGFVAFWVALFSGESVLEPLRTMWDGIKSIFKGLYDGTIGVVVDFVKSIIDWFTELWDVLVGHSIVPDMVTAIIDWFLSLPSKVLGAIEDFVKDILADFKGLWSDITSWFKTNVAPKFTTKYWKEKFDSIRSGLAEKWDAVKQWWDQKKPSLSDVQTTIASVKDKLSSAWDTARTWWNKNKPSLADVHAVVASVKDKLSSAWNTARTWWNNNKSKLSDVSVIIGSIKASLETAWKEAKKWFDEQSLKLKIKVPKVEVSWDYDISGTMATIADFLFGKKAVPKIDLKWYEQGGFPAMGEMFVAREAGPELVGKIGNRNAVVNNDQIVAAVSEGVYVAVAAAMGGYAGGQSDQAINVYLDGKQITAVVEKRQKERGATLMTGGMAYGY